MGSGKVRSASGVVLALLEQLCLETVDTPIPLKKRSTFKERDVSSGTKPADPGDEPLGDASWYISPVLESAATRPSLPMLLDALRDTCRSEVFRSSPPFILLDAWDVENMGLESNFQQVIEALYESSCKVFISSRVPPTRVVRLLWEEPSDIHVTGARQAEDIAQYVHRRIQCRVPPLSDMDYETATREMLRASRNE